MSGLNKKEWVDWLNTKVVQKAGAIDEEGNVLAIRRISTGPAHRLDKWDLPGGSVDLEDLKNEEEPTIEAIKREISEETGLKVTDLERIYIRSWVSERSVGKILGIAFGYKCRVAGVKPQVKLSEEHYDYRWERKEEILKLDFGDDGGLHKGIIERV